MVEYLGKTRELKNPACQYLLRCFPPLMPLFHTDGVMRMMRFLFEDISPWNSLAKLKKGYREKVEPCCRQALEDGLTHAWIDTCCIDKSS